MFLFDSDIIIIDAFYYPKIFPYCTCGLTVREVLPAYGPDVIIIKHQVSFLVDWDCQRENFPDALGRDQAY